MTWESAILCFWFLISSNNKGKSNIHTPLGQYIYNLILPHRLLTNQPESKTLPLFLSRYTFYFKNQMLGESRANIMSLKSSKNWTWIVYKLNAERNEYEAIVEGERSDIKNFNSKIRNDRVQEGTLLKILIILRWLYRETKSMLKSWNFYYSFFDYFRIHLQSFRLLDRLVIEK